MRSPQAVRSFVLRRIFGIYQLVISPLFHLISGPSMGCRFVPSCSQYGEEALRTHGFFKGMGLLIKRISRCQPFARAGFDPVPHVIAKFHLNPNPELGKVKHGS